MKTRLVRVWPQQLMQSQLPSRSLDEPELLEATHHQGHALQVLVGLRSTLPGLELGGNSGEVHRFLQQVGQQAIARVIQQVRLAGRPVVDNEAIATVEPGAVVAMTGAPFRINFFGRGCHRSAGYVSSQESPVYNTCGLTGGEGDHDLTCARKEYFSAELEDYLGQKGIG